MNWVELIGMTLIHFVWQGAALMLLALGLLFTLRKRSAQSRYLVCCLVLSAMGAAPVVTGLVLAPSCRVAAIAAPLPNLPHVVTPAPEVTTFQPLEPQGAPVDEGFLRLVVIGWTLGAGALAIRVCGGFFSLNRLKRSGHLPVPPELLQRFNELAERMKLRRVPRLYLSNLVSVPTVIGAFRGIVLLPASVVTRMSPAMLESILVHELAHVTRYDFLINALQSAIEVALFYHPAVWWVSQRIREERENCCDDLVIATLSDRKTYARALTTLAELRGHSLAVRADGGELLVRVRRILGETPMKSIVSPLPVALLLGGLLLVPAMQSFASPPAAFPQKEKPARSSTTPVTKTAIAPAKASSRPVEKKAASNEVVKRAIATEKPAAARSGAISPATEKPRSPNASGPVAKASNMLPSPEMPQGNASRPIERSFTGEPKDPTYYRRMQVTIEMDSLLEYRQTIVQMQRMLDMKMLDNDSKIRAFRRSYPRDDEAKAKAWEAEMDSMMADATDMREQKDLLEQRLYENAARLEVLRKQLEAITK